MLLVLIITFSVFISSYVTDCPQNHNYGPNCQYNCTNCLNGCDVTGACKNSTCVIGYYGTGCRISNIEIGSAPTLIASNCSVIVNSVSYATTINVSQMAIYTVFGQIMPPNSANYILWPNKLLMSCSVSTCQVNITISGGTFFFGVYFDFTDKRFADIIQSLVSKIASATCNSTSNPPTIFQSTISTVITTSTVITQPFTVSTISTRSAVSTSATTTLQTSNYLVQNLVANATVNNINVNWKPPSTTEGLDNYLVSIQPNNNQSSTSFTTSNTFYTFDVLSSGSKYTISVSAVYKNFKSFNTSTVICTLPVSDLTVDNVKIISVDRKSMIIAFPTDPTNYTCSTTHYTVGVVPVVSSSRRKRAASNNNIIPSSAIQTVNVSQASPQVTLTNLNTETNYSIYAQIYTNVNGTVTYYYSTTFQKTNGPSDGTIAGIVLGIILLLLLIVAIILLIFLYRRKRREPLKNLYPYGEENTLKEIIDDNKPQSFAYWSNISDKMEPRYLVLDPSGWKDDLIKMKFNNMKYCPTGIRFIEEFNELPNDLSYDYRYAEINYSKNKRQDMIPYDHNRVKLRASSISNEVDYINASYIDGYVRKRAYIVSQSPFNKETKNDFWRMIYENNVCQFVMSTESEFSKDPSNAIFWPQKYFKTNIYESIYGNICVIPIIEYNFSYYDIREFEVSDITLKAKPLIVKQYQFHGWTDNIIIFLDFYQTIKIHANISDGPTVVLGGSGMSPTGVYIAFDRLSQQVSHENSVNVFRVVAEIRRSRANMISSSKQYMFIYDLLFESLLCGQFVINTNIRQVYKLLQQVNPQSGVEFIHEQFYFLQTYHMENAHNSSLTKDMTFADSINLAKNLASIASPKMNSENIDTFWNTVFSNHIEVIVDLKTTDSKPYYIRENLQNFDITVNGVSQVGELFQIFEVSLYNRLVDRKLNIFIFQFGTNWVIDDDLCSEPHRNQYPVWVELIDHLILKHGNKRILAHCVNGWCKSGLFLTCYNAALKMYLSKYVTVYNVVKSMKFYRYEFVTSYNQFKFVFSFLRKWIDIKMPKEDYTEVFSGLLFDGTMKESLFTHEQTPVLRPEDKQKYAPSLHTLDGIESCDYLSGGVDSKDVVHYIVNNNIDFQD